jgi:C-terminal processing protease CtpA/Prc
VCRPIAPNVILCLSVTLAPLTLAHAQGTIDSVKIDRAHKILRDAYDAVRKNYYDSKYHGLDLEAQYRLYDRKIDTAPSFNECLRFVAAFLERLKDSHTYLVPPDRPYRFDYGFRVQLFGDEGFITHVRPGTDAESKVHVGDQIVAYQTNRVDRADFHEILYLFGSLMPRTTIQLDLRDPGGNNRRVVIQTKVLQQNIERHISPASNDYYRLLREGEDEDHIFRQQQIVLGDAVIWKMPRFVLSPGEVDHLFGDVRKHKSLILDLRGNPGGASVTLEHMLGNLFDHDVKVADRVGRKDLKPAIAKTVGGDAFAGKVIVIVDSGSASASELFARVVQLEGRGIVLGDRTSGSVMEAEIYPFSQGMEYAQIWYEFSVTEADLIMKDGKSLEGVGVTPNEIVLPTQEDLAVGRDPTLARAAELAGVKLDPAAAGKLFPFEWLPF